MAELAFLGLEDNAISDEGMRLLEAAVALSRLRACVHLGLYGNPGSEDKVQQALEQQRKLQEQWLTAEQAAQMK